MKGAYTNDYYDRLKTEQRCRTRGYTPWFGAPFSGNFGLWKPQDAATTGAASLRYFCAFFQAPTPHRNDTISNLMFKEKNQL